MTLHPARWSCLLFLLCGTARAAEPQELLGMKLLVADDFESGKLDRWEMSDPQAWKLDVQGQNHVLSQFQASQVETPVRSPFNRALFKQPLVGSFVLDVKLQSTIKDYPHRDMCLFFGFQDPAHLYYVHFGKQMDAHANNIFIVNGEPRKKISTKTNDGTNWDDEWHHARVVRDAAGGKIGVYFDDMDKPAMEAEDKTFTWGQVGIGTFDDTGNFDDVRLYGTAVEKPAK